MEIPNYDIVVQPISIVFPEGWNSTLDKLLTDENYSLEQYLEDEYSTHKKEIALKLIRSIL